MTDKPEEETKVDVDLPVQSKPAVSRFEPTTAKASEPNVKNQDMNAWSELVSEESKGNFEVMASGDDKAFNPVASSNVSSTNAEIKYIQQEEDDEVEIDIDDQ